MMVNRSEIVELVKGQLDEKMFLVDVQVSSSQVIKVIVDSYDGLTIDRCVEISRHLEQGLDRDREDFELQVSSPGLSEPFKVKEQFIKNTGRQVEIVTVNGDKFSGLLKEVTSDRVLLETSALEKVEGHKKKQRISREHLFNYSDIKSAKVVITFK